jgi:hypothetical protein
VDSRLGAPGGAKHIVGVADVALDQFDPDIRQRRGVVRVADQRADAVAALDQLLADIGTGLSGGAGDEDRAGHGPGPFITYRTISVNIVMLELQILCSHLCRSIQRASS